MIDTGVLLFCLGWSAKDGTQAFLELQNQISEKDCFFYVTHSTYCSISSERSEGRLARKTFGGKKREIEVAEISIQRDEFESRLCSSGIG